MKIKKILIVLVAALLLTISFSPTVLAVDWEVDPGPWSIQQ